MVKQYPITSAFAVAPRKSSIAPAIPVLVLVPSAILVAVCVYGFIGFTLYLSFTPSRILPVFQITGADAYFRLFQQPNWQKALQNLAIFGSLYVIGAMAVGLVLAIFIDQRVRGEGILRPIFLYPMALSFIVTGTAWKWFLNPGLGIERSLHALGWTWFKFDWLINPQMAIYTIVIAGVWQVAGFTMAMFLAGLRGIDTEILKAARVDGASGIRLYRRIIVPMLGPTFFSVLIVLVHMAIKSYDLVVALTNGGPGNATELPSTFMYSYTFTRNQMAVGSASAIIMLLLVAVVMVPYLSYELRARSR